MAKGGLWSASEGEGNGGLADLAAVVMCAKLPLNQLRITPIQTYDALRIATWSAGLVTFAVACFAIPDFFEARSHARDVGGDALNGYFEGSQYFVGSHGKFNEVTKEQFDKSLELHSRFLITQPLLFISGLSTGLLQKISAKYA